MARLLTSADPFPAELRGGAVAIGNFDAVHLGHKAIAQKLVATARELAGPAVIFTFDPPPGAILFPDRPRIKPLTTFARRAELFTSLGVDALLAYPTALEFLQLSAEDFFSQVIVGQLGARALVEGSDFRFGRNRAGDWQKLTQLCQQAQMQLHLMSLVTAESAAVSSTRVRELVTLGDIAAANSLLLEPYRISGEVVAGAQRGRILGFPTANLAEIPVLLPALGVYAGRVVGLGSQPLAAAIHIGPNPTFEDERPKVEVHIIQWQGELYGRHLHVELLARVRDVRKFASVDQLKQQLLSDVAQCRQQAGRG